MADPGEGSPPLFSDHTGARTAEKNFFGDRTPPPPLLSKGLDDDSYQHTVVIIAIGCGHIWATNYS